MADISLLFDVQRKGGVGQGSEATIRAQLQEIVNSINSKPFKIQFEADTSKMTKQIEDAVSGDKTSKKRQSNAKKNSQAYKEATQAINQYYSKLKQLSLAEKEAFDTYKTTGKTDAKYSSLIAELNHLKTAYDNAIASKNSMTAAEQTEITTLDTMQQLELASAVERRTNAILQNSAAMTSSETVMSQANATLARCTKAEHSHKQSSRDAVAAIRQKMAAVVQAQNAVKAGSATDEEAAAKVRALQEATKDLRLSLKENYAIIQQNGDATKGLGERLVGLGKKFTQWFGVSQLIMAAYRAIRKMITAVIELDTAMTELKKVTDETDETYQRFLENASTRAKKLGASLTDVVKTTADFARLGLSLEDAEVVSDAALVYKNVGDGIEDIDQASESLISTMQAFGIEAKDVMSIVDKFNITGNKFAISSGGVGDALLNSAAALHAAGNELDESIGLITAANTTIQNPEKVGTALKTISMYLRAAKTEAEDAGESTDGMANSVSELRGEILALTGKKVDIQIDENNFKSPFQILKELSKVWGKLSDISRANITELIGGKRNANVISSLIKDFEIAEKVVAQTASSSGSAMAENEKVLESIQGKLNVLSATFETLSQNFIGSGTVKFFINFATAVLNVLDAFAKLNMLLPVVIGNFLIFKSIGVAKNLANMKAQVSVLTQSLITEKGVTDQLTASVYGLTLAEKQELVTQLEQAATNGLINQTEKNLILTKLGLTGATTSLTVANKGLATSFKSVAASVPVWGWISLAITAVIEVVIGLTSWIGNTTEELETLEEEFENTVNTIKSISSEFQQLKASANDVFPRFTELAKGVTKLGENASLTDKEYAEFLSLNNQIAEMFPELNLGMDNNGNAMLALSYSADTLKGSLEDLLEVQRQEANQKIANKMPELLEEIQSFENQYSASIDDIEADIKRLEDGTFTRSTSGDAYSSAADSVSVQEYYDYLDTLNSLGIEVQSAVKNIVGTKGAVYTMTWDVNSSQVQNAIAGMSKEIDNYKAQITAKWNSLNSSVSAMLQSDFLYNDMGQQAQNIAKTMVSALDFSNLGLVGEDGEETAQNIEDYVYKNITSPLYTALSNVEVKDALENGLSQLEDGKITETEFVTKMTDAFSELTSSMSEEEVANFTNAFVSGYNAMDIAGSNYNDVVKNLINYWADTVTGGKEAEDAVNGVTNALSKLDTVSNGLDRLDKIYVDILNGEDFDFGSLVDEDFTKDFGKLDSYNEFIKTVANSPKDISACKEAFNKLTTEYIHNSDALKNVNDETRDVVIAMLQQKGVANAASIVDHQLAVNKAKLRYESELTADATVSNILALWDEKTASEEDTQALFELATAKLQTNEAKIDTYDDIERLEELARAAGATAESLYNVSRAKELIALADEYTKRASDLGTDPMYSHTASDYRDKAKYLREQAEELYKKPLTYDVTLSKNKSADYVGGSSSKKESGSSKEETWFDKQLAKHQHLVAMNKETDAEYLKWLDSAYKKAYKEGIIELSDYYKYQEEVYEGLRDVFLDGLSDVEHEISMRENHKGEEKKIVSLYQGLISSVEKEIAKARKQGLTDEDDYIQELQGKWQDYTDAIKEIREEITESAKDALDELIDYRIDMLKQEVDDEKESLDKKLDNLKEFYDKQKEMLQDKYDEEKYLEEQAEKRKSVSDIKSELAMLESDDSAWAQKRKLELSEELSTAEKDLADFEKDNALEKALDALDEAYNSQEAQIKREMDALEEKLNDPNALYNQALNDIRNNSKNQLYYQMLMYNRQYGDGKDETVKELWESAYGALDDYKKLFGNSYNDVVLKNETGVKTDKGFDSTNVSPNKPTTSNTPSTSNKPTTPTQNTQTTKPSLVEGSYVQIKKDRKWYSDSYGGGRSGTAKSGKIKYINKNGSHPYNIDGNGWVRKEDIVGYASGTKHATKGLHELYENGAETLFVSNDGSKYRILNNDDKVFNHNATEFLYDFANSEGGVLVELLRSAFGGEMFGGTKSFVTKNEIAMGDIIIQGNADNKTVSQIRRAQRENIDFILKEFTKLNK